MPGSNPYSQAAASGVATRVAPAAVPDAPDTPSKFNPLNFLSGAPGAVVSGLFSLLGSYEQRKASERLLRQQRDWQLEDWKRETEYNSPSAVMARMASAGLNPDLLQGGNTSNAAVPNQGGVPSLAEASGIDVSGINAAAATRLQFRLNKELMESEISLKKAQARDLDASAKQRGDTTELSKQQLAIQDALSKSHINVDNATVQHLSKQISEIDSVIELNGAKKLLTDAQTAWENQSRTARISLIQSQAHQADSSALLSEKEADRIDKLIEVELSLMQANASNVAWQSKNERFDYLQQLLDDQDAARVLSQLDRDGEISPGLALKISLDIARKYANRKH